MPTFFERLAARCEDIGSSLCVGIDPDPKRIPKHLGGGPEAIYKFCAEIIEATADFAAAFKPNLAFFESIGIEGLNVLDQALTHVPRGVPVIIDAKRGDIGSTAEHYARSIFEQIHGDATTVNPYLGLESVEPFLKYEDRGVYLLCLTSNAGAADFQLQNDLYLKVARKAAEWNTRGNVGLVVGATRPRFLTAILAVAPDLPMLIPGLGAQGGDLDQIMAAVPRLARHRLLFNVSRSIIYAADDETFGRAARLAAKYYCARINDAREHNSEK
ncbi:orotidine-5'-phosphate decarboxylase [bacterium]|nr:orotidine-5'-phosphate decarboxylase [bacterium]